MNHIGPSEQDALLALATAVLQDGARERIRRPLASGGWKALRERRCASFVTLSGPTGLRGCCGQLTPRASLVEDLVDNTWRTGFEDPRFAPVQSHELDELNIEISLLSALEPIAADSRAALLNQLTPGVHGLLIEVGDARATFLPKVWAQLPRPDDFLDRLLDKADIRARWSRDLRAERYTAACFGGPLRTWLSGGEASLAADGSH